MINLSYREADTIADFDFGRLLHHSAYQDVVARQFGSWDESVQDKFFQVSWERAPHKIVMFNGISIGVFSLAEHSDHLFLSELQILPRYQRQGIGTQVLEEQMDLAKAKGLPLRLQVLLKNNAQQLYYRLGFSVTNTTETHLVMEWYER